jgi:hypothetical protein
MIIYSSVLWFRNSNKMDDLLAVIARWLNIKANDLIRAAIFQDKGIK